MCVLFQSLKDADVDTRQFEDWSVDVRKGFLQRNCIALPINALARNGCDGLNKIKVDARSFLTQMNALTRGYMTMSNHVVSIGEDLKRATDRQDRLEKKQDKMLEMLEKVLESGIRKRDGDDARLVCSDVVATCQPKTPARLFVSFFKDSLHVLHHNQLKMKKWKCLSQKERRKISMFFRRQKKCVRHMLCFVASFPSVPPETGKPHTDWLKKTTLQTEAVERGLLNCWNQKCEKKAEKLTFSMIGSVELGDLDTRFAEQPPSGMTSSDLEMFRNKRLPIIINC